MSPTANSEARKRHEDSLERGVTGLVEALRTERDQLRSRLADVTAQRDDAYDRLDVLRTTVNDLNRQLRAMSRAL